MLRCEKCQHEDVSAKKYPCSKCDSVTNDLFEPKKQTNADRIRAMSDEELTKIIFCPYDTAGKPIDIMPCIKDGNIQELVPPEDCKKCMLEWLQSEVEE